MILWFNRKIIIFKIWFSKTSMVEEEKSAFQVGDKVQLILDKELGPDTHLHGKEGEIIDISFDDAGSVTGDPEDNFQYKVRLENGKIPDLHFRRKDFRKL
jgi:hypothetical protein